MTESRTASRPGSFSHAALFYRDREQYVAGVGGFVRAALENDEPVLVAVPGPRLDALRRSLGRDIDGAACADMTELGRNPGRILAALLDFAGRRPDRSCRIVAEPVWPARSEPEILEATRHEALTNTAFAGFPVTIVCPYDVGGLSPDVVADARRTHPTLIEDGRDLPSAVYTDPRSVCADCDLPLPEPAGATPPFAFAAGQLAEVRLYADTWVRGTALDAARRRDLVLAISEATANSVAHGGGRGTVRLWTVKTGDIVAEISDSGRLRDPLAGRRLPHPASAHGGRGLWMIHQLCDLVEIRAAGTGFTLRLHMSAA